MYSSSSTLYEIYIAVSLTPSLLLYICVASPTSQQYSADAEEKDPCSSFFLCVQIRCDRPHVQNRNKEISCSSLPASKNDIFPDNVCPSSLK
jgi:hypothetical protein